jgi:hypothetical protein
MTTARDVGRKILQRAGILHRSETPSSAEAEDCLGTINEILAHWALDSLMAYYRPLESFPLVPNVGVYTIGTGGAFNTSLPVQVVSAFCRDGTIDYEMGIVSELNFDKIALKTVSGIPSSLSFERNEPLGTIRIFPTPSTAYTLFMRLEKPFTAFPDLDTDVDLPLGWESALIHEGIVRVSPEYGVKVSPENFNLAAKTYRALQSSVARRRTMDRPPFRFGAGQFDSMSDRYV